MRPGTRIAALLLVLGAPVALSAPTGPDGVPLTVWQPDGTALRLRAFGDDVRQRYETEDGRPVAYNPRIRRWETAVAAPAHAGETAGGGNSQAQGGERKAPPARWERRYWERRILQTHASGHAASVAGLLDAYNKRFGGAGFAASIGPGSAPLFSCVTDPEYAPPPAQTRTNMTALCILVRFPDDKGSPPAQEDMEALLNGTGYAGHGNTGSVRDYFSDQSGGRFHFTAIVTPYILADQERKHYGRQSTAVGASELLGEAVEKLPAFPLDLSPLTRDGNEAVGVYLLYTGEAQGGLWPHMSSFRGDTALPDGTLVRDYMVSNIGSSPSIGTICHESGHMALELLDYYDYGSSARYDCGDDVTSAGVGAHDLMGAGNSLNNSKTPAPLGAYLKHALGWASSVPPAAGTMVADVCDESFYRIGKPGSETEYFIVENKTRNAGNPWNDYLPASGLAVWHVDEAVTTGNELQQMTEARHYELSLEQADGRFDLERSVRGEANYGDATDYFDGAPGRDAFTDETSPSARWWDGSASGAGFLAVGAPGAGVTLRNAIPVPDATVSVPAVTGSVLSAAEAELRGLGLVSRVSRSVHDAAAPGTVISQRPPAGTLVPAGGAVDMVASRGPLVAVPDVTGQGRDAALSALAGASFVPGGISQWWHSDAPADTVVSQSPMSGVMQPPGASVSLVFSLGAPATAAEARAALLEAFRDADRDGDNRLSFAEAQLVVPSLTQEVFDTFDRNRDGLLGRTEIRFGTCGCGCKKSDMTVDGLKSRLGDLFLGGLALTLLAAAGRRRMP